MTIQLSRKPKLSQLEIDCDKDWQGMKITNLVETPSSTPPEGMKQIRETYIDPADGDLVVVSDE